LLHRRQPGQLRRGHGRRREDQRVGTAALPRADRGRRDRVRPGVGYSARSSSPGRDLAASSAGPTASRFAAASTATASTASGHGWTTGTGTTPKVVANVRQTSRPATTPSGTPTTSPASATVVACQQTAAAIWFLTNPITLSSPVSLRLLVTLTSSRCTRVAAPNRDSIAPNSSGKLTDSPKLTSSMGLTGTATSARYWRM